MPIATINHIEIDERGNARIAGTRVKVRILIDGMKGNHQSVEELIAQYPHLSPSQIHAALSYYYDHQSEIDRQSAEAESFVDQMQADASAQPTRAELEARRSRKQA